MRQLLNILLLIIFATLWEATDATEVYVQIPSSRITAKANSEHKDFPAKNVIDGSGMYKEFHQSDNLGRNMWITDGSDVVVSANKNVRKGKAWIKCELDTSEKVDLIQIWNHNQSMHTQRGLQKVFIEYSADGLKWSLLKNGNDDFFVIPQAIGRKQEPASISIETGGIDLKYLCITAAEKNGNYYFDNDKHTLLKAEEMNQNPHYYGLSEIRLYNQKRQSLSQLPSIQALDFKAGQGYLKTEEGPKREFTVRLSEPLYAGGSITIKTESYSKTTNIGASKYGISQIGATFPPGYMEEDKVVEVVFNSPQGNIYNQFHVPAARKWKIYFLPHSHLDIGYTHRQQDVMDLQIKNLEKAIELSAKTRDYPDGARYKWNAEATWAVDGFIEKYKGTKREQEFIEAVREGEMGLDATLGSILTGISKQEELMHYFDDAHKIAKLTGVEINTAMMSDVPGQSWGIVTAMAENGVRYFSSGPNYVPTLGRLGSHGVGLYNLIWGDVPFWWKSQSGTHKILYWQTGKGYSMFHGWLLDRLSVSGIEPVWDYLEELESKEYPYGLTYLRYTIHGDNGPPDEEMPEVILRWNELYESPQFIIGTTKELFSEMEEVYGDYLPVYSGDMTPVWEDGAASTAHELSMNRASAERLNQFEILWSIANPSTDFPKEKILEGWKNVILFSEHTWGAAASGPEPESQFTKDVWEGKKLYADKAHSISTELQNELLRQLGTGSKYINVYNTNLWNRSDIVRINGTDFTGKSLLSPEGKIVPIQKLHEGTWIFYAEDIKPLSSSSFEVIPSTSNQPYASLINGDTLQNNKVKLVADRINGSIKSYTIKGTEHEFAGKDGLNQYLYTGRNGENLQVIERIKEVRVLNEGEVAATLRIESDAPGCRSLTRDITIYRDIDRIDIVNTLDKLNNYNHENVRFYFPFNIHNPEIRMDLAMSEISPERDQLISANKNFYSVQNGISVSDIQQGIYLSTLDAPFVELGSMTADLSRTQPEATGWLNASTISADVYSWVMNNRWRTNYKASQEGIIVFNYSLKTFNPTFHDLKRFGAEQAQPLIAVSSDKENSTPSLFRTKNNNRLILSTIRPSTDGKGYIIRLQNATPFSMNAAIESEILNIESAFYCDNREITNAEFKWSSFWMKPFENATIKIIIK